MPSIGLACVERSLVMVIDMQPKFLRVCESADFTLDRTKLVVQVAQLLDVPVVATEQYPSRMGNTDPRLLDVLTSDNPPFPKMVFSAWGDPEVISHVQQTGRTQIILCGIETQICITQTAHDLLEAGMEVFLCTDAISGRGTETKDIALRRMADAGAILTLADSVVYEWLQTAEHPQFRPVLELVKA